MEILTDIANSLSKSEDERKHFDIPDVVPYSVQTVDNSSQYDCHSMDATCQYDTTMKCDTACQYEPTEEPKPTKDSCCQYDIDTKPQTAEFAMSTDLMFDMHADAAIGFSGFNMITNIPYTLAPSDTIKQVVATQDSSCLTDTPPKTVDSTTNTVSVKCIDMSTATERKSTKDISVEKFTPPCRDQITQTFIETPSVVTSEISTNTEYTKLTEHETQTTHVVKQKSRSISVRPSVAEYGIDVKPTVSHSHTYTEVPDMCSRECQTDRIVTQVHQSTNTDVIRTQSKGTTAHVAGVNSCTSTHDLMKRHGSSSQTENQWQESKEKSCNTVTIETKTTSTGPYIPFFGTSEAGVGTDPSPKLADTAMNTAIVSRSDSWTNPAPIHKSSKACGTDQIKRRTVGLYVRPSQKDSFSMTTVIKQADKSCGWSWAKTSDVGVGAIPACHDQCDDTDGLVGLSNREVNTEGRSSLLSTKMNYRSCLLISHDCTTPT